jgi:branched-chain amino acid transport system permease protein
LLAAFSLVAFAGFAMLTEMLYHLSFDSANGTAMNLFGVASDTASAAPWTLAGILLMAGSAGFLFAKPGFQRAWESVHADLAADTNRGEEA